MRHKLTPLSSSFPARPRHVRAWPILVRGGGSPVVLSANCLGSPSLGYALAHQIQLVFLRLFKLLLGDVGESRLEGGWVLLEESAEVQSVVRGLRGQIKGLQSRGRGGVLRGRGAGGVLPG